MNNEKANIDYINLITKYLSKETNQEEAELLHQWITSDDFNRKLFDEYKKAWESVKPLEKFEQLDIDAEWERMESIIDGKDVSEAKVISINNKDAKQLNLKNLLRIAAIWFALLLPAGFIYYYFTKANFQYVVAENEIKETTLSDGSKIALNNHSSIKYDDDFGGNNRTVVLHGEAFFEIKPDKNKPFIIHTASLMIKVHGTSFNVKAIEKENNVEVIVATGKVELMNGIKSIILKTGEKGVFSKTNQNIIALENNDINYLAWKTKKLLFKNQTLSDMIETINHVYNSNIVLSETIRQCHLSVSFDHQSLEEVLHVIQSTLNLRIERNNHLIKIEGEGC